MTEKQYKGSVIRPGDKGPLEATDKSRPSLDVLGLRLDQVSWENLEEQYPLLAGALQETVDGGYSPQQIRQYVMQRELPMEWARWLQQAARWLKDGADA